MYLIFTDYRVILCLYTVHHCIKVRVKVRSRLLLITRPSLDSPKVNIHLFLNGHSSAALELGSQQPIVL